MTFLPLIQHEIVHFSLSILAAILTLVFIWYKLKKRWPRFIVPAVLGGLIGEFFLDADHLFDYVLAFGFRFYPYYFFKGVMFDKLHKTFVPLHSWELVIILGIITYFVKNKHWHYFLLAVTLGLALHLVYDVFYNHITFFGYSFLYRWLFHFNPQYFSF